MYKTDPNFSENEGDNEGTDRLRKTVSGTEQTKTRTEHVHCTPKRKSFPNFCSFFEAAQTLAHSPRQLFCVLSTVFIHQGLIRSTRRETRLDLFLPVDISSGSKDDQRFACLSFIRHDVLNIGPSTPHLSASPFAPVVITLHVFGGSVMTPLVSSGGCI